MTLDIDNIQAICRWDDNSVDTLYDRYYKALVGYCGQITSDDTVAEDLVQELFFKLWEKKPVFNSMQHLKSYLYNSVRNLAINHLRHERVKDAHVVDLLTKQSVDEASNLQPDDFNEEEVYRQLFLCIDRLPPRQREIFLLAMEGKKNQEIAALLSISTATVKVQKRRLIITLRKMLSPTIATIAFAILFAQA